MLRGGEGGWNVDATKKCLSAMVSGDFMTARNLIAHPSPFAPTLFLFVFPITIQTFENSVSEILFQVTRSVWVELVSFERNCSIVGAGTRYSVVCLRVKRWISDNSRKRQSDSDASCPQSKGLLVGQVHTANINTQLKLEKLESH